MDQSEFARMGGLARAKKLTRKRRKLIAQMGGRAGGRGRPKVLKAGKKGKAGGPPGVSARARAV